MTHTTVELKNCTVDISPEDIRISVNNTGGALSCAKLSYAEFDELLEAVARTEKFAAIFT